MAAPKPKDVHVDLLEVDMKEGHWLKPRPGDHVLSQDKVDAIRKKHRDKWLAEQKAKRTK